MSVCICSPSGVLGLPRPQRAIYRLSLTLQLVTCCFAHSFLIPLFLEGLLVCGVGVEVGDSLGSVWKTGQQCHFFVPHLENQPGAGGLCQLVSCETF